ncbi:MAG: arginine deiminase-related protein [Bacteroidota bacterium]
MDLPSYQSALIRKPGINFREGITTANLGVPSVELALQQHQQYQQFLEDQGVKVWTLEADVSHPDCPFVEDTMLITEKGALSLRPHVKSRRGEVESVSAFLSTQMDILPLPSLESLEGGDIVRLEDHFFVGLSKRSQQGAVDILSQQLRTWGFTVSTLPVPKALHLKSLLTYLGKGLVVAAPALAKHPALKGYEVLTLSKEEQHGANCLSINGKIGISTGCPDLYAQLKSRGLETQVIDLSEFRKMDGALSCLSLLW